MARYLLVETRDPFATEDLRRFYDLPASLARASNRVMLYLTDDGVLAARDGQHTFWIAALTSLGVEILADTSALRERGIAVEALSRNVRPTAPAAIARLAADRATIVNTAARGGI
jgi:sulfur relay (sulfurtransferase) complex TusBCD TusD component (DsrE family)